MDKQELLDQLSDYVSKNLITKEEILAVLGRPAPLKEGGDFTRRVGIAEVLYGIGAAIVFIGIAIFVGQNWKTLDNGTKILSTLGSGVASYIVGVLLGRNEKFSGVAHAFYFISALVLPVGLSVTFDINGYKLDDLGTQSVLSGILFGTYLLSFIISKKNVFNLFSIIYGTWLFFSFTGLLVKDNPTVKNWNFFEYRTLVTGITYLLMGYSFRNSANRSLSGPLYAFGVIAFLGASFALGKWEPNQNMFWELLFPGLVFGVIFLSVRLKSKSFLTFGSLFLMGYIGKLTAEYFKNGLGWPLALILAGLLLIAVGYYSLYLNKKYLSMA